MSNKELAEKYLEWFSKNYTYLKNKYFNLCKEKQWDFDEDIFSDTYLKIYDIILRNGIKDSTDRGFECYTFRAFQNNIRNEKRYSRNSRRDYNITSDNIEQLYETFYNATNDPAINKVMTDLFKDFALLFIMTQVEEYWDSEHFYLFKIKTLVPNMTFKRLQEQTNIKSSRKKTIEVMRWVKDNIKKEDIKKAFNKFYDNLGI